MTYNRRVKRHQMTTTSRQHGKPSETEPDSTIFTQRVKIGDILLDPKLDSKIFRIQGLSAYKKSRTRPLQALVKTPPLLKPFRDTPP